MRVTNPDEFTPFNDQTDSMMDMLDAEMATEMMSSQREKPFQNGPMMSASGSYNPSSVAIQAEIQQLFDPFADMVSNELRFIAKQQRML